MIEESHRRLRLGVVTEPLADKSLVEVMDWLHHELPEVTDLEIGTGAYASTTHCDMGLLLSDSGALCRWQREISARGLRVGALNVWGNPLHPDRELAAKHDRDLRLTIRLAAALGVNRVVAMAGCPGASDWDRVPHFAAGGWLPYLEGVYDWQWEGRLLPYWSDLSDFARREHHGLLVCLELHPGTAVYNVDTFQKLAAIASNLAANIDPSHLFWMGMDAHAVVSTVCARVGHAHAKDTAFSEKALALNGLLDHRWPRPAQEMPWNFATVGRGHDRSWWGSFVADLTACPSATTLAIEHEDPFVAPEAGIAEAARLLVPLLAAAASEVEGQP